MHHHTLHGILYILIALGCISYFEAGAVLHKLSHRPHWLATFLTCACNLTHMECWTHPHTHMQAYLLLSLGVAVQRANLNLHEGACGRVITWPTGRDPVPAVCVDTRMHTQMNPLLLTKSGSHNIMTEGTEIALWLHPGLKIFNITDTRTPAEN